MEETAYVPVLNKSIQDFFKRAFLVTLGSPRLVLKGFRFWRYQKKAARIRRKYQQEGTHVPPFMIISITSRCNLNCKGCYAHAQKRPTAKEMEPEKISQVICEGKELGVSIMLIAGGEPFVRDEFLDITEDFPEIIFPVFTNGLRINAEHIRRMKKQKQLVPVVSMEGIEKNTDGRRGTGVYGKLEEKLRAMKDAGIFFGVSLTLTRDNFDDTMNAEFMETLMRSGTQLVFLLEYVPVEEGTENLILTEEQTQKLVALKEQFRRKYNALFVIFPGDEEDFGGCLSSGRGFIHISPDGKLEPCPMAPYSDADLNRMPLKEALHSPLLKTIRANKDKLKETRGGCALWEHRAWVQTLVPDKSFSGNKNGKRLFTVNANLRTPF